MNKQMGRNAINVNVYDSLAMLNDYELLSMYEKLIDSEKRVPNELLEVMDKRNIGTDFASVYYFDLKNYNYVD